MPRRISSMTRTGTYTVDASRCFTGTISCERLNGKVNPS
jgi:hypothetical protein